MSRQRKSAHNFPNIFLGLILSCFIFQSVTAYGSPFKVVGPCGQILHHIVTGPSSLGISSDLSGFKSEQAAVDFVMEYYSEIDAKKVDKVLQRFSNDAQYLRSGKLMIGKSSLKDFYFKFRSLDGSHLISEIKVYKGSVASTGQFVGKFGDEDVTLQFVDIWWFDAGKELAIFRESIIWKDGVPVEA